jgi:hypothetical protein
VVGPGGTNGGGNGGNQGPPFGVNAQSGTVNTGGGGGGTSTAGPGIGGSGIVVVRTSAVAVSTTGSPTVTTDAGDNVYSFLASGTITF